MRIVLVNLPWKKGRRWGVRAGSRWPHIKDHTEENYLPFPFYLAYGAALLKNNSFDVEVIDAIAEKMSYRRIFKKILDLKPQLLVAETSTVSLMHDLNVLSSFKGKFPIVLCGPEQKLADPEFLEKTKSVDYMIYGEYEATLLDLSNALKDNSDLSNVLGLVYRKDGSITKNSSRELIQDLDQLPWPMREELPIKRYNDSPGDIPIPCASMWASRGCPFKCSFCLWPQIMYGGNSYRTRSIVDVVDEMEYLVKKLGFKSIYFDDDTWNIGRQRMFSFCAELEKRKLIVPWAIMARAELMDEELLERMNSVGLYSVKYGVESSSQQLLNNIQKGTDLKNVEEVIKYTKYLGIKTHLTFTFGLPGETRQTIKNTIEYAKKLNPTSVQFSIATPFPGTRFFEEMDKKGFIVTKDWNKFDGNHKSVIRTEHLSANDLQRAKKHAYVQWDKHCQMRYKNLFTRAIQNKTIREKFITSLNEHGYIMTSVKIVRFILRRLFFLPLRVKQIITKKMFIVEDIICNGDLKLTFGESRIKLFWKGIEISKDVGLTTSLHYSDRWVDSSQASWSLEKVSASSMVVKLKWDDVPIRQQYKISIDEHGGIMWSVDMKIEARVQIFEYKAGIMLQDSYNMWKDDLGIGKFPQITDWEEIELYNPNSPSIVAMRIKDDKAYLYPEVELRLLEKCQDNTYPQIQNTNKKINSRLLQMRALKVSRFEPGNYHCFIMQLKADKDELVKQDISMYRKKVPMQFIKEQISKKGFPMAFKKIAKYLCPKNLKNYYMDIVGVLDGSFAYKGPYCVQLDITNDCNNDCIGCWCNSPLLKDKKIPENVKAQELPYGVVKQTIDQLAQMGTKEIYFAGGGEPFMHHDILKILEHVKRRGLRCYVNTNFTLVDEEIAKKLVELKVDNMVVSVWAATAETYFATHPNQSQEMFYQIKGFLQFINQIKQGEPRVNIYNVISNLNYKELEQMVEFAIKTNCDSVEFTVIDTIPKATDSLMLNDQQRKEVHESCKKIKKKLGRQWKGKIKILQFEQFIRRVSAEEAKEANYDQNILSQMPCYVGWLFARILADGNVNFCLKAHRIPVGNIYAHDFAAIWNGKKQQEFRKRALCKDKNDAFFSFIGNDPDSKVGCFKSCDDLARNIYMHKKIQSLSSLEMRFLQLILYYKKLQKFIKEKRLWQSVSKQIKRRHLDSERIIHIDKLKAAFHEKGIKLFFNDVEITQSVGLSTSVCIFGLWYDSSQADWELVRHSQNEIVAKYIWKRIPIRQQWKVRLFENNILSWQVRLFVDSRIEIEQEKASVMLNIAYRKWSTEKTKGRFPRIMNWNEVSLGDSMAKKVRLMRTRAKNIYFPEICYDFSENNSNSYPELQNSDKATNARIISVTRGKLNEENILLPGEYESFSSRISFKGE